MSLLVLIAYVLVILEALLRYWANINTKSISVQCKLKAQKWFNIHQSPCKASIWSSWIIFSCLMAKTSNSEFCHDIEAYPTQRSTNIVQWSDKKSLVSCHMTVKFLSSCIANRSMWVKLLKKKQKPTTTTVTKCKDVKGIIHRFIGKMTHKLYR